MEPDAEETGDAAEGLSSEQMSELNGWKEEKDGRLAEMAGIEDEYATLKERLYQQRLTTVQKLLDQLREGAHPRYKQQRAELELELEKQKQNAEVRKAYRMVTLDHHTAYTTKRARQDYEFRVTLLKSKMLEKLQRDMRQLETEKREINTPVAPDPAPLPLYRRPNSAGNLCPNPMMRQDSLSPPKRSARASPPLPVSPKEFDVEALRNSMEGSAHKRRRKTPVTSTQFPFVVYMLSEDEVMRDLDALHRYGMRR